MLCFLAIRQIMANDWLALGRVSWFSYCWETGRVPPLDKYGYVVREHGRFSAQAYAVVPATACDPFMTVEAAHQKLPVFRGEADNKGEKSSGLSFSPVAASNA